MSVPKVPSNVTSKAEAEESAAARRVREGKAANYDLTDPSNPKIKGQDGDWHPAPAAK
jgi:hypothetical protein